MNYKSIAMKLFMSLMLAGGMANASAKACEVKSGYFPAGTSNTTVGEVFTFGDMKVRIKAQADFVSPTHYAPGGWHGPDIEVKAPGLATMPDGSALSVHVTTQGVPLTVCGKNVKFIWDLHSSRNGHSGVNVRLLDNF